MRAEMTSAIGSIQRKGSVKRRVRHSGLTLIRPGMTVNKFLEQHYQPHGPLRAPPLHGPDVGTLLE